MDADLLKAFGEHQIEQVDMNNTTIMGGVAFRLSNEQPPLNKSGRHSTGIPTFKFHLDELVDKTKYKTKLVQMRVKDGKPSWQNLPEEIEIEMNNESIENQLTNPSDCLKRIINRLYVMRDSINSSNLKTLS